MTQKTVKSGKTKPAGKISKQPWMVAENTVRLMQALHATGGEARFVGGCVRDALVNRPVYDVDIATTLRPEDVIDCLKAAKIPYAPTGLKHGTVTAIVDGHPYEITTLRIDVQAYGRHADVSFTDDWSLDAARRDFTINAMSCTLEGDVYDYFGGMEDLHRGRVVFVGDPATRIREDVLRILRFFRFFAHFGRGEADAEALLACADQANKLSRLSAERVRVEIIKLLEAPAPAAVWRLMQEQRVLTYFLPEATNVEALERLQKLESEYSTQLAPLRRLAALLDVTLKGLRAVTESLRLSNEQVALLAKLVDPGIEISTRMSEQEIRQVVYRFGNDVARHLLLLSAARTGDTGELYKLYNIATSFRVPRFMLTGQDVMALGYKAGPKIGEIMHAMEAWWMDEDFRPGRTALIAKLKEDYGQASKK